MLEKIDKVYCPICTALMEERRGNGFVHYKRRFLCGMCKIETMIIDKSHKDYRRVQ